MSAVIKNLRDLNWGKEQAIGWSTSSASLLQKHGVQEFPNCKKKMRAGLCWGDIRYVEYVIVVCDSVICV
jgi:hypothetical protein